MWEQNPLQSLAQRAPNGGAKHVAPAWHVKMLKPPQSSGTQLKLENFALPTRLRAPQEM